MKPWVEEKEVSQEPSQPDIKPCSNKPQQHSLFCLRTLAGGSNTKSTT